MEIYLSVEKRLFILFIALIFLASFVNAIGGYNYNLNITVYNNGSALTDQEYEFYIDTKTPIDALKMRSDCADMDVKNQSFESVPFYLDSFSCNNPKTNITARLSTLANNDKIYILYGNSSITSFTGIRDNGTATFHFYEGFNTYNTADLNGQGSWSATTIMYRVSSANPSKGSKAMDYAPSGGCSAYKNWPQTLDKAKMTWWVFPSGYRSSPFIINSDSTKTANGGPNNNNASFYYAASGVGYYIGNSLSLDNWHKISISEDCSVDKQGRFIVDNDYIYTEIDRGNDGSSTCATTNRTYTEGNANGGGTQYIDEITVSRGIPINQNVSFILGTEEFPTTTTTTTTDTTTSSTTTTTTTTTTIIDWLGDESIILNYPENSEDCIAGETINFAYTPYEDSITTCFFFSNLTGTWINNQVDYSPVIDETNYFNMSGLSPGGYIWGITCSNDTNAYFYAGNYSFVLTDAPYCAVLSDTNCSSNVALNTMGVFKTRLGNTKGFWLENQDCNVWIEDSTGVIVKKYNSMLIDAETSIMLDSNGNWINTASNSEVVLTDSGGWYVYPFEASNSWAWVDDVYTIHAVCNGQETSCQFTVLKEELPDIKNYEQLGKEAGGVILFIFILIAVIILGLKTLKGRL